MTTAQPKGLSHVEAFLWWGWDEVQRVSTLTPCWEYRGYRNPNGYGRVHSAGKPRVGAHRVSYEYFHATLPIDALVLHACDNPPCVNPSHLKAGTPLENMQDRDAKNRGPRGERNGFAKLDNASVEEIHRLRESDIPVRDIADMFDVHWSTIYRVLSGARWSK